MVDPIRSAKAIEAWKTIRANREAKKAAQESSKPPAETPAAETGPIKVHVVDGEPQQVEEKPSMPTEPILETEHYIAVTKLPGSGETIQPVEETWDFSMLPVGIETFRAEFEDDWNYQRKGNCRTCNKQIIEGEDSDMRTGRRIHCSKCAERIRGRKTAREKQQRAERLKNQWFKATISDTKLFKGILENLHVLVDEVDFIVDRESFKVTQMDPSHVAMVAWRFPKQAAEEFEVGPDVPFKIRFNLEQVLKFFKNLSDESLKLSWRGTEEKLIFKFGRKLYSMPTLEASGEEVPQPKIQPAVKAKIVASTLNKSIRDIADISDQVEMGIRERVLKLHGASEVSDCLVEYTPQDEDCLSVESKNDGTEVCSKYSLSYLEEIAKALGKIGDVLVLEFDKDMPLKLSADAQGFGDLCFWLAPRIEAE